MLRNRSFEAQVPGSCGLGLKLEDVCASSLPKPGVATFGQQWQSVAEAALASSRRSGAFTCIYIYIYTHIYIYVDKYPTCIYSLRKSHDTAVRPIAVNKAGSQDMCAESEGRCGTSPNSQTFRLNRFGAAL